MSWISRLANLVRHRDLNGEIDEELQFHLDARTRDNLAAGMSPVEARRDAVQRFGSRSGLRERTRDADIIVTFETIVQDLSFAFRSLRKHPGFTAVVLLTLALGIGANASIFTIVESVLLRPLPFAQPDELYAISDAPKGMPFWLYPGVADSEYLAFREADRTFEATATFGSAPMTLSGAGDAVHVSAATVSPDFFRVLRVHPVIGRSFAAGDDQPGRNHVVLIGNDLWRSRFAADPGMIDRTVVLDGIPHAVVGILPAGFSYPAKAELWTPLSVTSDPHLSMIRPVIGRLRPDVTRTQAQAAFETFVRRTRTDPQDGHPRLTQIVPLKDAVAGDVRGSLLIFAGAVALVLLIACANVANLLLMRATARRQEIATRLALGASRGRIVRQVLTESALLSFAGGVAGILIAVDAVPALLSLVPPGILPRDTEITVDRWVLAFTLGLSVLTGLALGAAPALQSTRDDLSVAVKEGTGSASRHSHRVRHVLVVSEIALALMLLVGAGLLLRSFVNLRSVDPGFDPRQVITMTLDLPESRYPGASQLNAFHERLLTSLARMPGAVSIGAVNWLPLGDMLLRGDVVLEDRRPIPPDYAVTKSAISPGYFAALDIHLRAGRIFDDRDKAGAPGVAILSESVARTLWPDGTALGKRISLEDHPKPSDWLTIVGIVADVRQEGLTNQVVPAIYQPYGQVTRPFFLNRMTYVVRTSGAPDASARGMRQLLTEADSSLAPQSIATMEDVVGRTIAEQRFQTRLLSIFSILALLLAAIGIYGVLASSVLERRREIGIRVALGADRGSVMLIVLRRTIVLAVTGVAVGAAGAFALTRVLEKLLFDVRPNDLTTFLVSAGVLVGVALSAGLLPARRASGVDPLVALRSE